MTWAELDWDRVKMLSNRIPPTWPGVFGRPQDVYLQRTHGATFTNTGQYPVRVHVSGEKNLVHEVMPGDTLTVQTYNGGRDW